jgi:hypothetical protein
MSGMRSIKNFSFVNMDSNLNLFLVFGKNKAPRATFRGRRDKNNYNLESISEPKCHSAKKYFDIKRNFESTTSYLLGCKTFLKHRPQLRGCPEARPYIRQRPVLKSSTGASSAPVTFSDHSQRAVTFCEFLISPLDP